MTVSSQDLINSIHKNHSNSVCEADWRGICSRSYYAIYEDGKMFHQTLPSVGILKPNSPGGLHQDLIERLNNPGLSKTDPRYIQSKKIGALMETLHAKRIKSDYKRLSSVSKQDAEDSIAQSNTVYATLFSTPLSTTPTESLLAGQSAMARQKPTLTRIK